MRICGNPGNLPLRTLASADTVAIRRIARMSRGIFAAWTAVPTFSMIRSGPVRSRKLFQPGSGESLVPSTARILPSARLHRGPDGPSPILPSSAASAPPPRTWPAPAAPMAPARDLRHSPSPHPAPGLLASELSAVRKTSTAPPRAGVEHPSPRLGGDGQHPGPFEPVAWWCGALLPLAPARGEGCSALRPADLVMVQPGAHSLEAQAPDRVRGRAV